MVMTVYRFALLGNPVAHSRSPRIHETLLQLAGLDGGYETIQADEKVLAEAISGLRRGSWQGLNVTMPLKAAAARSADALSPQARRSGSVNTLLVNRSGVYGDSTDSTAFRELMHQPRFSDVSSMLVLGAGGTAAAVLAAADTRQPTYVAARRLDQAHHLTVQLGGETVTWGAAVAGALVVNTTPLGMSGETLPDGVLDVASGLIDLPYAAVPTPAVTMASGLGIPWADGHEFLLRQAMASFAMWTGHALDFDNVAAALRKA
jgi:shikimate dehydrogenase